MPRNVTTYLIFNPFILRQALKKQLFYIYKIKILHNNP